MDLPWLRPLIETGYLGVDGFFLLSGFVLWLGYGSRPPTDVVSLGQFWLRRFARTWPLHALVLLALAALVGLVVAMAGRIHDPERFGLRDFLLQAVLVHAWETTERLTWNSPSWALSVEWAGYLAFPLLVQAWRQVPAIVLLPAIGLCLAGLWVMAELSPGSGLNLSLHLGLLRFFLEFAMGLSLGRLATEGRLPAALPVLAGSGLVAGLLFRYDALAVAGLGALIAAIWQRGAVGSPLKKPDLSLRLGEASFGIYICWVFVEAGMVGLLRVVQPSLAGRALLMATGLTAALAIGWLAWRYVEEPGRRWLLQSERKASGFFAKVPR
jgi:peptidoglycan/LPS O-acetylase OafA/YrhL